MANTTAQALKQVNLRGQNKTAVIIGGTLGMGAAIARQLATLGCSRIIIFGRNQKRGEEILTRLKELASGDIDVQLVLGDLATVEGMRTAAEDLQRALGSSKIDYLIMCQNGLPAVKINETEDGNNALAEGATVLSVANAENSSNDLSVDDLDLRKKQAAGRSNLMIFLDRSFRDSTVLDAWNLEMQNRYPQYRFCHIHPGLVTSEEASPAGFPFPMNLAFGLALKTFAQSTSTIAETCVYITLNLAKPTDFGDARFFNHKLQAIQAGAWAKSEENRSSLWPKLKGIIEEA